MRTAKPRYSDSRCPHCGRLCRVLAMREEIIGEVYYAGDWFPMSECCEVHVEDAREEMR